MKLEYANILCRLYLLPMWKGLKTFESGVFQQQHQTGSSIVSQSVIHLHIMLYHEGKLCIGFLHGLHAVPLDFSTLIQSVWAMEIMNFLFCCESLDTQRIELGESTLLELQHLTEVCPFML